LKTAFSARQPRIAKRKVGTAVPSRPQKNQAVLIKHAPQAIALHFLPSARFESFDEGTIRDLANVRSIVRDPFVL